MGAAFGVATRLALLTPLNERRMQQLD
jgi:hypothetical protein